MPDNELTAEAASAMIDALAPVVGLTVAPDYRPGVILNLQIAQRLAQVAASVPLDDHDEPAAVFEA